MSIEQMRTERNRRKDAERRKRNALAQLRGEPTGLIDATPIRARAKTLTALGWSLEAIIHAAGNQGTAAGLRLIANGTSRKAERKFGAVANLPITLNVPDTVPDQCFVPSLGAVRRIRALMAIGWRHDDISEFIGRASHHLATGRYPRIAALDWRVIDAAYERLSAAPGGSVKSLTRARKAGFVPPMAWTDIDDPGEVPTDWEYRDATRAELLADLVADGATLAQVCWRLKLSRDALSVWCKRNDLRDLYDALVAEETAA